MLKILPSRIRETLLRRSRNDESSQLLKDITLFFNQIHNSPINEDISVQSKAVYDTVSKFFSQKDHKLDLLDSFLRTYLGFYLLLDDYHQQVLRNNGLETCLFLIYESLRGHKPDLDLIKSYLRVGNMKILRNLLLDHFPRFLESNQPEFDDSMANFFKEISLEFVGSIELNSALLSQISIREEIRKLYFFPQLVQLYVQKVIGEESLPVLVVLREVFRQCETLYEDARENDLDGRFISYMCNVIIKDNLEFVLNGKVKEFFGDIKSITGNIYALMLTCIKLRLELDDNCEDSIIESLTELIDDSDADSVHDHLNSLLLKLRNSLIWHQRSENITFLHRSLALTLSKMVSAIDTNFQVLFYVLSLPNQPEVISRILPDPKRKQSFIINANDVVVNYYSNSNLRGKIKD